MDHRRSHLAHPLPVQIMHWIGAAAIICMILSGWAIYNASPLLPFTFPPWVTLGGWLGGGIAWHLSAMWVLCADGLAYLGYGILFGHFRRDIRPPGPKAILRDLGLKAFAFTCADGDVHGADLRHLRKGAKAVNFGAIYGQGPTGLMRAAWEKFDLVLTRAEAEAWTQAFKDSYPDLAREQRERHQRCQDELRIVIGKDAARGIGRVFPFSRLKENDTGYTRSRNLPIQGACADAAMIALTYVDDRLFNAGIDGGPVAWLHDEIVLEVKAADAERAATILKQSMIDGFAETFPGAPLNGLVDLHIAGNWAEAKG